MMLLALCSSLQVENEIFEFQSAAREYSNFIKFPANCRALNERLGMTKHAGAARAQNRLREVESLWKHLDYSGSFSTSCIAPVFLVRAQVFRN